MEMTRKYRINRTTEICDNMQKLNKVHYYELKTHASNKAYIEYMIDSDRRPVKKRLKKKFIVTIIFDGTL
jgi:hypothetical protein